MEGTEGIDAEGVLPASVSVAALPLPLPPPHLSSRERSCSPNADSIDSKHPPCYLNIVYEYRGFQCPRDQNNDVIILSGKK